MADPVVDSGLVIDAQGRTNLYNSELFDVGFRYDDTIGDYIDRIFDTLVDVIEEHIPAKPWIIEGHYQPHFWALATIPPLRTLVTDPSLGVSVSSTTTRIVGVAVDLGVSIGNWCYFFLDSISA